MNPSNEKQADVPAGAEILPNQRGTAPGFAVEIGSATAYFMPGVPKEMKGMFAEQILPRIRPSATNNAHQIVLHVYGMRESTIGEALTGVEAQFPGVTLGYRVHFPECDVKVHARAGTHSAARDVAQRAAEVVKQKLGDAVYGEGEDAFPEVVGRAVRNRGYHLAVAESCTGGLVSHLLTSYPASDYLIGGAVTYANSAKTRLLGGGHAARARRRLRRGRRRDGRRRAAAVRV
jgi:nicotinamide-nucleotide amidase